MDENMSLTQKDKIAEDIKTAILSEIPIIFLKTDELSLIHRIVLDEQLIEPLFFPEREVIGNNKSSSILNTTIKKESASVLYTIPDFCGWVNEPKNPIIAIIQDEANILDPDSRRFNPSFYEGINKFVRLYQNASPTKGNSYSYIKQSTVIIATPTSPIIPKILSSYVRVINVPPIKNEELRLYISKLVNKYDGVCLSPLSDESHEKYLIKIEKQINGLNMAKIRQIFMYIKADLGYVYTSEDDEFKYVLDIIQSEKEKILANSGCLKLIKPTKKVSIYGMSHVYQWLNENKDIIKNYDIANKTALLKPIKGVLISGIPGSGKSRLAKACSEILELPLISMDLGLIRGKYVGESEHRMTEALHLIESLSPCVVWIDEIEKAMGKSDGDETGVSKRLLGQFLTWMQEKEEKDVCCFVIATANNISGLPPELFRNGRFDAKYYTFMPSLEECDEIFHGIISDENDDFLRNKNTNLYDKDILKLGFLKNIIDSLYSEDLGTIKAKLNEIGLNEYNKDFNLDEVAQIFRDRNKFLIGADIVAAIEQTKRKLYYYHNLAKESDGSPVFKTQEFKCQFVLSLSTLKTFGETNLDDITNIFLELKKNNFSPVGDEKLFSLDKFDVDEAKFKIEPWYSKRFSHYDNALFDTVRKKVEEKQSLINERKKQANIQ